MSPFPAVERRSKAYADRPAVVLPEPANQGDDLYETIRRRRSRREWVRDPLAQTELSNVLYYAFGAATGADAGDPSIEGR